MSEQKYNEQKFEDARTFIIGGHKQNHEIIELKETIFKMSEEIKKLEKDKKKLLDAEHKLSDAYLRIRGLVKAFDTPHGPSAEQVWKHTEEKVIALLKERDAYRRVAINRDSQPLMRISFDYSLNAIEVDEEAKKLMEIDKK